MDFYYKEMTRKIQIDHCNNFLTYCINLYFFLHDVSTGLQDAVNAGDVDTAAVGRRAVLPSSYVSGPRYMLQLYQDAMTIVCLLLLLPLLLLSILLPLLILLLLLIFLIDAF